MTTRIWLESEQIPSPERIVELVRKAHLDGEAWAAGFEVGMRIGYEMCRTARLHAPDLEKGRKEENV